jgi:hypothetical protein
MFGRDGADWVVKFKALNLTSAVRAFRRTWIEQSSPVIASANSDIVWAEAVEIGAASAEAASGPVRSGLQAHSPSTLSRCRRPSPT